MPHFAPRASVGVAKGNGVREEAARGRRQVAVDARCRYGTLSGRIRPHQCCCRGLVDQLCVRQYELFQFVEEVGGEGHMPRVINRNYPH